MSGPHNPPAFPFPEVRASDGTGIREGSDGMTLRDWFAGQALSGLLSGLLSDGSKFRSDTSPSTIAVAAFQCADTMLGERSRA